MTEFIQAITDFFTSDKFQAIMTSIGTLLLAASPVVYKLITTKLEKWKLRLQGKTKELFEALELANDYKAIAETESAKTKQILTEVTSMIEKQNEAMNLAFSRSNLKEDVKTSIDKILKNKYPITKNSNPSDEKNSTNNITSTPVRAIENGIDGELPTQTAPETKYIRKL